MEIRYILYGHLLSPHRTLINLQDWICPSFTLVFLGASFTPASLGIGIFVGVSLAKVFLYILLVSIFSCSCHYFLLLLFRFKSFIAHFAIGYDTLSNGKAFLSGDRFLSIFLLKCIKFIWYFRLLSFLYNLGHFEQWKNFLAWDNCLPCWKFICSSRFCLIWNLL